MYTILVVGAGYLGSAIACHFSAKNQKVYALSRTDTRKAELEKMGVHCLTADLTNPDSLAGVIPRAHFIVLSLAPDEHDEQSYRRTYLEGVGNFLKAIKNYPKPRLIVYLSSTKVWGRQVNGCVDELTPPDPGDGKGKILVAAEEQVLRAGLPAVIFRLSGIYGPNRNRISSLRNGLWPKPGEDRYVNMIHREDAVAAMQILFNKAKTGEIYLGTDHEPVLKSEIYRWLASQINVPYKEGVLIPATQSGKLCRNQKLKDLGFFFRYPSFRVGYGELLT
jgi:nucleoside-diphosphate-sugar epimerase